MVFLNMAGKIRSLLSRILKGRRPKPPKLPPRRSKETLGGGHRGIAAGSLKLGETDLSAGNVAKWRSLPAEAVEGFVYEAEPLFVHSTNVVMMQYFIEDKALLVEFKNGTTYKYENVTEDEAILAAKAQSKGGWVWDDLRIRGTKLGHKKPYAKVSGGPKPPKQFKPSGQGVQSIVIDGDTYYVVRDASGGIHYKLAED